jgi:molecular chaperone GrpE (heat shock protein)
MQLSESDILELRQLRKEIDDLDKDTLQTQAKLSVMRRRLNQILSGGKKKPVSRVIEIEDCHGRKYKAVSGYDLD